MTKKYGFTLIELLVVIAIIAVLMGILMPALNRARLQGKRAVCMGNLKQISLAWIMYADENDDEIVSADTHTDNEDAWVKYEDDNNATEEEKLEGITTGTLYPFCSNVKSYRCPTGVRGEVVTYTIVDAMNGYSGHAWSKGRTFKKRMKIKEPATRIVFLDEGRLSSNSWSIWYTKPAWWDQITKRHGQGTTVSFADGHGEYYKWSDPRTTEVAKQDFIWWQATGRNTDMAEQENNKDLEKVQRGCWGGLGYTP